MMTDKIELTPTDVEFSFIRSPGPGGQNVNKVASGVLLRFNIRASNLPEDVRNRLLLLTGRQVNQKGELLIKATKYRTQERNKADAMERLQDLVRRAVMPRKKRRATKVPRAVKEKRLENKKKRSQTKLFRRSV